MTMDKSPEKFDPTTHKFGMAYLEGKSPTALYPSGRTLGHDGKSVFYEIIGGKKKSFNGSWPEYRCRDLTRAPEHDLIPRIEYESLLSEAQRMKEALEMCGLWVVTVADAMGIDPIDTKYDMKRDGKTFRTISVQDAMDAKKEALASFNAKFGTGKK